jgi:4-fold beta-flower domain-containing protein
MKTLTLYNSNGDPAAFMDYPHIYNLGGEWVGFVSADRSVHSVLGHYVGYLSDERRILRPRTMSTTGRHIDPPPPPPPGFVPPANIPLAPLMSELTQSIVDVFLEQPERLHTRDVGELRADLE